ncbi:Scr1 family TA system antitoxin-like transcriptional regulator [Nonomuraea diastatica]|uniref:Scr1 family TA system antitoxin-like transcriptional regulator n=1 Tax=Nonomuraea diastatica TaxID=1848329 RepID=UPI003CCC74FF
MLRSWDPLLIPGLLQTEDYAQAVFRGDRSGRSLPPGGGERRQRAHAPPTDP